MFFGFVFVIKRRYFTVRCYSVAPLIVDHSLCWAKNDHSKSRMLLSSRESFTRLGFFGYSLSAIADILWGSPLYPENWTIQTTCLYTKMLKKTMACFLAWTVSSVKKCHCQSTIFSIIWKTFKYKNERGFKSVSVKMDKQCHQMARSVDFLKYIWGHCYPQENKWHRSDMMTEKWNRELFFFNKHLLWFVTLNQTTENVLPKPK